MLSRQTKCVYDWQKLADGQRDVILGRYEGECMLSRQKNVCMTGRNWQMAKGMAYLADMKVSE